MAGECYFWLNRAHSDRAVANYAVVLADSVQSPRVRLMARHSFRNYVKSLFDFFRQMSVDPDLFEADAFIEGGADIDAALALGKGVLLLTPHVGNWDLAAGLTATRGYNIVALADRFSPPAVDRLVRLTRERSGVGVVTLDSGALRRTAQLLQRNTVVGILADRPQREGGVEVKFFGQPAWLPAGPARFALRTGAVVMFGYVGRRPGDQTYFGRYQPLPAYQPTGDLAADIQGQTEIFVRAMEDLVRQYPDQWFMFRRMWPDATQ
jgi:KDO2-lipid IV(A) lauroyltransferase